MQSVFPAVNPDAVRLDGARAPYPPAPGVIVALQDCADGNLRESVHRPAALLQAASAAWNVGINQIYAAPGERALELLCRTLFFDCRTVSPPVDAARGAIGVSSPDPIFGELKSNEEIAALCAAGGSTVLLDERLALEESGSPALLSQFENLVILRSLSYTHGLMGINAAFALCSPRRVHALSSLGGSPDLPACRAAAAALADRSYTEKVVARMVLSRESLRESLTALSFSCAPSQGVFLSARHARARPKRLRNELSRRGVEISFLEGDDRAVCFFPGTEADHDSLLYALRDILRA